VSRHRWQWDEGSIRMLHELQERGLTDAAAAAILKCRVDVLRNKAAVLGLGFIHDSFWTDARIEDMQELLLEGYSRLDIANYLETSSEQISLKVKSIDENWIEPLRKTVAKVVSSFPEITLRELSESTGYSPVLVHHILQELRPTKSVRCACTCDRRRVSVIRYLLEKA
jgi:hypothetical protein